MNLYKTAKNEIKMRNFAKSLAKTFIIYYNIGVFSIDF